MVALDKYPGVRPIGIGDIFRRLMGKCVVQQTRTEATNAAGTDNLSAGLSAGIEGAVHTVGDAWNATYGAENDDTDAPTPTSDAAAIPTKPYAEQTSDSPGTGLTLEDDPFVHIRGDGINGFQKLNRKGALWTATNGRKEAALLSTVIAIGESLSCEVKKLKWHSFYSARKSFRSNLESRPSKTPT